MFMRHLFGWLLFRTPSLALARSRRGRLRPPPARTHWSPQRWFSRWSWCGVVPLLFIRWREEVGSTRPLSSAAVAGAAARRALSLFARENAPDFIYFQF